MTLPSRALVAIAVFAVAVAWMSPSVAQLGPLAQLGSKIASPEMQTVTDRNMGEYFAGLISVTEAHAEDCDATMRVASGSISVSGAIVALRRIADCGAPKPILALRLTVDGAGVDSARAAMRAALGEACFDGAGAMGAPSQFWSDQHRLLGIVQDTPPGRAFSIFFVNLETAGSSEPKAEAALRRALEADVPTACK